MPWFRVDDGFMQHAKVLAIPRRDRMACVGLWVAAGTWSARNLKDGKVPFHVLDEIGGTERLAVELVKVGLWRRIKTGYIFHNWKEFQPTRADVMKEREDAKERMRKAREARKAAQVLRESSEKSSGGTGETAGQTTNGSGEHFRTHSERSLTPTRPDPTRPHIRALGSVSEVTHQGAARPRKPRGVNVGGEWINSERVCPHHPDEELSASGICRCCEADRKAESA